MVGEEGAEKGKNAGEEEREDVGHFDCAVDGALLMLRTFIE
jgi:hypothetical protein